MKTIPRWGIWTMLAAVWWTAWAVGVYMPLHSKEAGLIADRDGWQQEKTKAHRLLAAAPQLVAQIDSVGGEFHRAIANFVPADSLQRLIKDLRLVGRQKGIRQVEIIPNLASALEVSTTFTPAPNGLGILDSLLIEFKASGRFARIGAWLDEIEQRADFLQWTSCRWERGPDKGMVNFSGKAELWIVAPYAKP